MMPTSSNASLTNAQFKQLTSMNQPQLIAQSPNMMNQGQQLMQTFQHLPHGLTWTPNQQIMGQMPQMFFQTSSPQMQSVSMGTPLSVNQNAGTINLLHQQAAAVASSHVIQQTTASNTPTTTMTSSSTQQLIQSTTPALIAPAPAPAPTVAVASTPPTPTNKLKPLRPANNASTQTAVNSKAAAAALANDASKIASKPHVPLSKPSPQSANKNKQLVSQ